MVVDTSVFEVGEVVPPLAVYTEYQQQGIATRLVREGHACLAAMGETLSIVVGEPGYYVMAELYFESADAMGAGRSCALRISTARGSPRCATT